VLADGTYNVGCLQATGAARLWSQHLGGATLTGGLEAGSNSPGTVEVHGLKFDISSSSHTCGPTNAAIDNWGARTLTLEDTWITGHRTNGTSSIGTGINSGGAYAGMTIERVQMTTFEDYAIHIWNNDEVVPVPSNHPAANVVADVSAADVHHATPGSTNGTAESAVWIGEPVTNGVHRIAITGSFIGLETVNNSWNTTFSDLNITCPNSYRSSAGVYLEHYSEYDTFTHFSVGQCDDSFNCEWYAGQAAAACHYDTITDGTLDARGAYSAGSVGVYLDAGTEDSSVTNTTFIGQGTAGIVEHQILSRGSYSGDDFSQLTPGAVPVLSS
jgi:hypothetical protein